MAKGVSEISVQGNVISFKMGLKKDSPTKAVPDPREYVISCKIDCEGMSRSDLFGICFSGQSARVKLQQQLRKKSHAELASLEASGLSWNWKKIYEEVAVSKDPADILMAMSEEQFVEWCVKNMGIDEDTAYGIYCRKHGINVTE